PIRDYPEARERRDKDRLISDTGEIYDEIFDSEISAPTSFWCTREVLVLTRFVNLYPVVEDNPCKVLEYEFEPVITFKTPIRQIATSELLAPSSIAAMIAARTFNTVSFLSTHERAESLDDDNDDDNAPSITNPFELKVVKSFSFREDILHVAFNTKMYEEAAMVLEDGGIWLWNAEEGRCRMFREPEEMVSSETRGRKWMTCDYGAHPRHLMVFTYKRSETVDLRSSTLSTPLFTPKDSEHIFSACANRYNAFQVAIATSKRLLLLDTRYTKQPLISWDTLSKLEPVVGMRVENVPVEGGDGTGIFTWTRHHGETLLHYVSSPTPSSTITPTSAPTPSAPIGKPTYRLKPMEKYEAEQKCTEQPSKRYFAGTTLPEIINSYPVMRRGLSQKEVEKEMQNRQAFIDFLQGLLNLNPFERWSPQQAKMHPFITGAKFTGPFTPPIRIMRPLSGSNSVSGLSATGGSSTTSSSSSNASSPGGQRKQGVSAGATLGVGSTGSSASASSSSALPGGRRASIAIPSGMSMDLKKSSFNAAAAAAAAAAMTSSLMGANGAAGSSGVGGLSHASFVAAAAAAAAAGAQGSASSMVGGASGPTSSAKTPTSSAGGSAGGAPV
ncbi:dual specificity protein kinase yak1, partial [Quaeritorhiza haematococci]